MEMWLIQRAANKLRSNAGRLKELSEEGECIPCIKYQVEKMKETLDAVERELNENRLLRRG